LLTAGAIIAFVAIFTFALVLLFKCDIIFSSLSPSLHHQPPKTQLINRRYNCMSCIWAYMGFSGFVMFVFVGGQVSHALLYRYSIPTDVISFLFLLYNVSTTGVITIFFWPAPLPIKQAYLVAIGALVSYWLTRIPSWTTWALLIGMALYDIVAVLCPGGPLKMLVEMASNSNQSIPALVYETSPMDRRSLPAALNSTMAERSHARPDGPAHSEESQSSSSDGRPLVHSTKNDPEVSPDDLERNDRQSDQLQTDQQSTQSVHTPDESASAALSNESNVYDRNSENEHAHHDSFKLGLGDFVFYSVMVGRAALHDYFTVLAVIFAILLGLQATLIALATGVFKALPALPISIGLGVLFYFLSRYVLEFAHT
jgi:presenilin 1